MAMIMRPNAGETIARIMGNVLPLVAGTTMREGLREIVLGGRQERFAQEMMGQCLALQSEAIMNSLGPKVAEQVQRGILSDAVLGSIVMKLSPLLGKVLLDKVTEMMMAFYETHKMKIKLTIGTVIVILANIVLQKVDQLMLGVPSTGAKMALALTKVAAVTTLKMAKMGGKMMAPALVNLIMTMAIFEATMPKQLKESLNIANTYMENAAANKMTITEMIKPANMNKALTNAQRMEMRRVRFGMPLTNAQKMEMRLKRFGPAN